MDTRKIVAVIGATGKQGGSVVRELSAHRDKYIVRGLTSDVASPHARELKEKLGIEMRTADLNAPESLQAAFDGAQIIYDMTDFWQSRSAETEFSQGKALMDVITGVPDLDHLIWASLPDGAKISEGRYSNIFHWQSKAAVTNYIRDSKPALWEKTTEILFPNYFENCLTSPSRYLPVKTDDGVFVRSFPLSAETLLPNVSIADTGRLVDHVIRRKSEFLTKTIAFYSEALSERDKADTIARVFGIPVEYRQLTPREFQHRLAQMDPTIALDYTEQLMMFEECGMIYSRPEFIQANQLPGLRLTTWGEFIASHDIISYMVSK
ncbi:NAD(P)-binding protein [Aspergillus sclerotiicarbonarius CBS 121057]|uniref:NAD(P)-binding protein n=1 Tax=Aspergillus sclerotiicarbonarius (strain CBS 121057 / IBT 28362) TaxID=1448318 RepID=A0A319EB65_ASPSB|nr:NAD(P)-binding protein [Aspergillus sclerotiicarbonarius CBS 121057]